VGAVPNSFLSRLVQTCVIAHISGQRDCGWRGAARCAILPTYVDVREDGAVIPTKLSIVEHVRWTRRITEELLLSIRVIIQTILLQLTCVQAPATGGVHVIIASSCARAPV